MRAAPLLVLTLGMFGSAEALAGGIGVITTGGMHQELVYVYDAELNQYRVSQQRPNLGFGLQAVLGDRDDRVQGTMEFFYQMDTAPLGEGVLDAAKADGASGELTFALREEPRHIGLATVGVQWGLFKDPNAFQPVLITSVGAGALTNNNTEFVLLQVGPGVVWRMTEQLQLNADLTLDTRYRKAFNFGGSATVGLRFLFD